MKNTLSQASLNAAIAAVLSQKFSGGAEVVPRDPESFPAPVSNGDERSYSSPKQYVDLLDRKTQHNRKRKKIAKASRKRNRK